MNAIHVLGIVLVSWPAAWPCACLLWWMWRHRRIQFPRRSPRRGAADGAAPRQFKFDEDSKRLLYLCARLDRAGCRTIARAFDRWHSGWVTVSKSTVWKFRREHAGPIQEERRRYKRRPPYFVPAGHTWSLDLTFVRSPFGGSFTVLGILDAGLRKLLRLEVLPTKCALVVLGHLLIAIGTHGLPAAIRTDNEAMFLSKPCLAILKALGIAHRRGPPLQPWRNARIERLFGTLKPMLREVQFATARELQAALDRFSRWYNEARPHQALDGLTPDEVWQGQTPVDVRRDAQVHRARVIRRLLAGHRWRSSSA